MPNPSYVGCFTLSGLTVVLASGYTGYIGSRERITPMNENKDFAREVYGRELGRVARAVADIPCVCHVWPDAEWPKALFVSVLPEGVDS